MTQFKNIILVFIISFLFISISLASSQSLLSSSSESSSSPAASKYIYAIAVIENYKQQQLLIIDPWENNTILSESLQLNFEIDDILIVEESNTFIIYSESTNQSLISINPKTLESNIINKISPPITGFEDLIQPSVFINEKKILYKPVVDISGGEFSSLLRLDFENGVGTFVNISNESEIPTLGSIPNVAYDVLNDYVFACYNSSSNNVLVAFNETTSDIIETYGIIKNIQGFDVNMMFTDKLGNLFLVYQDNSGGVYVCEVDSVLMECQGVFKYNIGTVPYAFTPYFLSRDKSSLVFITYIDENQFLLEIVDFNHGFKSKKTIFSNSYLNSPFNVYWGIQTRVKNNGFNFIGSINPIQRLLFNCVWEALEDSSIDPISLRGTNTSSFIGSSVTGYLAPPFKNQSNISSIYSLSNQIGHCYGLRGENLTIDTDLSSSLNPINCGYNSIKSKNQMYQLLVVQNNKIPSDVRPNGIGIVVLKRLKDAVKDSNNIYCIIKGSCSNNNDESLNFCSPSKSCRYQNIKLTIKSTNGKINESNIDYYEVNNIGTPISDSNELKTISRVFNLEKTTKNNQQQQQKQQQVLIGSIKSNIGYTEGFSGVVSLIKCCLMFKNKLFIQNNNNNNFKEPNSSISFKELNVVTEPTKFNENKTTTMLINNLCDSGSNDCLVLSEFKNNYQNGNDSFYNSNEYDQMKINNGINEKRKYLIPLSSNSLTPLVKNLKSSDFKEFVFNQIRSESATATATTPRTQKSVIIASDWNEFLDKNNQINGDNLISNITVKKEKSPIKVFVFCGQASQYNRMALSLYENEPIFREFANKVDKELSKYYGYSILERLRSIHDDDIISIHESILAQPANIIIQVSLYELYKHWGITADIMVGHSLGEESVPYCSGMINLETLCYMTYHRAVAQNKTNGSGGLLVANISSDEFINNYQSKTKYSSLEIAVYNSPTSIIIAGQDKALLKEIEKELKSKDVFCSMRGSLSSFHTSSQLAIKDDMFIKHSIETIIDKTSPYNAEYVFENIYKPVYFMQTITNIYNYIESNNMGNEITFIEISPHPTLQNYLNEMKSIQSSYFDGGKNITTHSPLHRKKKDYKEFLKTISSLYVNNNFNINFRSQIINNNSTIKFNP
ncbi:hypothetical protein ACTA71_001194 [Dictyostelium dimigraforme]